MTMLERLKSAKCRTDGVSWNEKGELVFRTTNVSGPWTAEQKAKVCAALGRKEAP